MKYLIDTSTCIHAMRGNPLVVSKMSSVSPDQVAISTVSCYELYTGVEKCADPEREREKVDLLIGAMTHVAFDSSAATHAAKFRADLESRGEMIGPYDVLLAGQAYSLGLTLVSGNTREFVRIAGLTLENWETHTP